MVTPKTVVRPMETGELRAAWKVVEKNRPEYPPPGWPANFMEFQRLAVLHPRSRREGTLVAASNGEIVGVLVFHPYAEEGVSSVCLIAVDRSARRAGLGKTLMQAWEENSRNMELKRLVAPECPDEDEKLQAFVTSLGFRKATAIITYERGDEAVQDPPDDEHVVPIANVSLKEVTEAFNDVFPDTPRTQEDLHALLTQSRWGPWASLAYAEGGRVLAFLFTTDREGKPYLQYVGTRKEARRRGLALTLLKSAFHILRQGGARYATCEVYEYNVQAAHLAESFGMKPGRRRTMFIKDLT